MPNPSQLKTGSALVRNDELSSELVLWYYPRAVTSSDEAMDTQGCPMAEDTIHGRSSLRVYPIR
jgi:hypothetical protein